MKHCKKSLKRSGRALVTAFLFLAGALGAAGSAFASQVNEDQTVKENLYALTVSTGAANGDGISLFAVNYTSDDGKERTEYILPYDGSYQESLEQAAAVSTERLAAKNANLQILGYTTGTYASKKPLRANSTDTFLLEFPKKVESVNSIDIITDVGTNGTAVQWDCVGMEFCRVTSLNGLDFNGYYSNSYEILYDGELLASTVIAGGKTSYLVATTSGGDDQIVRVAPEDAEFHLKEFYLKTSGGTTREDSYKDVFVELDLADVYGGGIEAFTNMASGGSIKNLSSLYLPEVMTLKIFYKTPGGSGRTVTVPVVTSALSFALENTDTTSPLTAESVLADYMGQGESVVLKLRLYDYGSLNTDAGLNTNLVLSYDPVNAASNTGLTETSQAAASHSAITGKILASDTRDPFSLLGIYFYEYDGLSNADARGEVQDGTILTYDLKHSPKYYYSAGSVAGTLVEPSSDHSKDMYFKLAAANGSSMRPRNTTDNFVVVMRTTDSALAASTSNLKLKLGYMTAQNGTEYFTENYDVAELVKNYFGYWPATNGGDASYMMGMRKGEYLYCLIQLNGVDHFTSATLSLQGNDPWQCQDFHIYQVGDSLLSERHVIWQSMENGGVSTDRLIYRKFNSVDVNSAYGTLDPDEDDEEPTTVSESGINISGLDNIRKLTSLMDVEVYLDSGHATKRIDFESKQVDPNIQEVDWRDTGKWLEMTYEDTRENLGFIARKKTYTIEVNVGTEDYESANGDPGSGNYFYFQLEFEKGTSSYVQANQQLAADGFIAGQTARFEVTTNYDYGNLMAINVIPDDSTTTANPYDKLKIDSIMVSTVQQDNTYLEWVCQTTEDNAWVGIDYVEEGANTSSLTSQKRDAADIMTTYQITSSKVCTAVLVAINTGSYEQESEQLQATQMYANFNVTRLDGTSDIVTVDVLEAIYAFSGESPIINDNPKDTQKRDIYLSNPESMFRSGQWNFFIMKLDDVKTIDSVDIQARSLENEICWTINDVVLDRITEDNGRKINKITDSYVLDGTTERIACADKLTLGGQAGWSNTLSPDTVKTYHIPFEAQEVNIGEATTEAYELNRTPLSNNDYLNISVFMKADGTDYSSCTVNSSITYSNTYDTYYRTSPTLKRTLIDGQYVYSANGVGCKNMTSVDSVYLSASFSDRDDMASVDYIIVQRIREGVVVENYYFAGLGLDITSGIRFYATGGETTPQDYQVVTVMLGSDTIEADLTAEKSDIAIALRYTMTTGSDDKVYQSPFIYLTDMGVTSIRPNQMLKFTLNQKYVKEIKGIVVAATGNEIYAFVDSASVGNYTYDKTAAEKTEDEEETTLRLASDVKAGYKCSSWYSIIAQQKIMAGSASFAVTGSVLGDYQAIVPMKVTFKTMSEGADRAIMGLTENARVSMVFLYTGMDGNAYVREFADILDYTVNRTEGSFTTGSSDVVAFMEQNMNNITGIVICPYDEDESYVQSWGIESVTFSYGDGSVQQDIVVPIGDIAYENMENVTKYPGLFVGIKDIPVTATVESVCGITLPAGSAQAVSGSSQKPTVRINQAGGSVRFSVSTMNTTQGVKVVASRDRSMDSSNYLKVVSGSTLEFTPPSTNLPAEITYTIRVYANENPACAAEFDVVVDPNLHEFSCNISTTDTKPKENAVFLFTFSDPMTENSTMTVKVNEETYTVPVLSGQSTATLTIPVPEDFSGALTAQIVYVTGDSSQEKRLPISNTATCNVTPLKNGSISLSAAAAQVYSNETMQFNVNLSDTADSDMTVTLNLTSGSSSINYSVNIPAGQSSGTLTINGPSAGSWHAIITGISGGGFDSMSYADASADCTVIQYVKVQPTIQYTLNGTEPSGYTQIGVYKGQANTLRFVLSEAPSEEATVTFVVKFQNIYSSTNIWFSYIDFRIPAGQTEVIYTFDETDGYFKVDDGITCVATMYFGGISGGGFSDTVQCTSGTAIFPW